MGHEDIPLPPIPPSEEAPDGGASEAPGEGTVESNEGGWVDKNAAEYVARDEQAEKTEQEIGGEEAALQREKDALNERTRSNPADETLDEGRRVIIQRMDALAQRRRDLEQFRLDTRTLEADPEAVAEGKRVEVMAEEFSRLQNQYERGELDSAAFLEASERKNDALRRLGSLQHRSGQRRGEFFAKVDQLKAEKR